MGSLKAHILHAMLSSMAYRHARGHPERMGKHFTPPEGIRIATPEDIQLITIQAWTVVDGTHITGFVTQHSETGPKTFNVGADLLPYRLLQLPSLGQIVWCLGDEIQHAWRELSTPK